MNSPHVIPIHQYGEIEGRLYVDMRLIEGRDLETVLADGPLDPARAVNIVGQVAKALHAAHKVGLLHRDIKPSNILLDDDDFAYLIDFGIARALDETRMTKSGYAIGTFQYIAPERLGVGNDEDARADIYSLACVLYQCLTGSPPFPGDTMAHLIAAHLNSPPPRPSVSRPQVPAPVDEVIARGMAKDPHERYATTVELAKAAREAITVPIQRPDPNPIARPAYAHEAGPQPASRPPPPRLRAPVLNRSGPPPRFGSSRLQNRRTPSAARRPDAMPSKPTRAGGVGRGACLLFILGGILLVVGYLVGLNVLWTIGVLLLVIGFVMMAVGWARQTVGERRQRRSLNGG